MVTADGMIPGVFFGKASGTLYLCLMAAVGMIAWSSVIILAFVSSCTSS